MAPPRTAVTRILSPSHCSTDMKGVWQFYTHQLFPDSFSRVLISILLLPPRCHPHPDGLTYHTSLSHLLSICLMRKFGVSLRFLLMQRRVFKGVFYDSSEFWLVFVVFVAGFQEGFHMTWEFKGLSWKLVGFHWCHGSNDRVTQVLDFRAVIIRMIDKQALVEVVEVFEGV